TISCTVTLYDAEGRPVVRIGRLHMARARTSATAVRDAAYRIAWEPRPRSTAAAGASTDALVDAAERSLHELGAAHDAAVYGPLHEELGHLSPACSPFALQSLGWKASAGDVVTVQDVMQRCGIVPRYAALVRRMLRVLQDAGVVAAENGDTWRVTSTAVATD